MATLVTYQGRKIWTNRRDMPAKALEWKTADGQPYDPRPVAPDSSEAPLRIGVPWTAQDGVTYRVVYYLDPRENWQPIEHWMARYAVTFHVAIELARRGMLDSAVEAHSPTKRYRCRDEAKILAFVAKYPRTSEGRALPPPKKKIYQHKDPFKTRG